MTFSIDSPHEGHHFPHLSCPECGINSVVQHGSIYFCLNCGFRRNVSESRVSTSNEAIGIVALLTLLFAIAMIVVTAPAPTSRNQLSPNSYPTDQQQF